MDESQPIPQAQDGRQCLRERPNQHAAPGTRGHRGRDSRNRAQSARDCGSSAFARGKLGHDYQCLQHHGLGRPGRERYLAHLRDGRRNRYSACGSRARLQQRDYLRPAAPRLRLNTNKINPASLFLGLAGTLLFLILFSSTVSAQSDLSIQKVVYNVTQVDFQDAEPHYAVDGQLTWLANYENTTADWGYIPNDLFVSLGFVTIETIPGRTNWLTFNNSVDPAGSLTLALEGENDTVTLAVGIGDGSNAVISCILTILPKIDTYECGFPALQPVSSLTQETITEFPPVMSSQLRHPQAASDVLLDGVMYEYQIQIPGTNIWTNIVNYTTITANGIVYVWGNTTDWEEDLITVNTFRVRVRDQRTHEASIYSCSVQAQVGSTELGPYNCIGTQNSLLPDTAGDPTFPLADVPGLAAGLGVSAQVMAGIMSIITGLVIVAFAAWKAGVVGAVVSSALMIALMFALNVIPPWALVVIFLGSIAIIAMRLKGGNANEQ